MNSFLKYFLYFLSTILILTAGLIVYLLWFQPPFYFPKPTGQYAVGSKEYHWVDAKRKEIYSDDPKHPYRELMVKIWYPANGTLPEKPTTPYAPQLVNFLKKNYPLLWLFGLTRPIYTYAQSSPAAIPGTVQSDPPMLQNISKFPVIVFCHGRGAVTHDCYTAHCENLASHGYVVVAINHTYCSLMTQFPNGRLINGKKAIEQRSTGKNFTQIKELDDLELETWICDVQFVLDQLGKIEKDRESSFYQRLDLQNIGIFGHSVGGATAVQICRRDARVKAGVNLDGGLFGSDREKPFGKPFMFMLNDKIVNGASKPLPQDIRKDFKISTPDEEKLFQSMVFFSVIKLAQSLGKNAYIIVIKNSNHLDFSDIALLKHSSRFLRLLTGSINGFRATEIVNDYLVNFFDKYLKNKPSELLDGDKKFYPEVETRY